LSITAIYNKYYPISSIVLYCFIFLASLCQNTPQLANAVEIALSGQMYLVEGQYEAALEKYTIGLNLLEKLLEKEPPGIRYNLLIKQVNSY
jgi:hypothetical protein